MADSSKDKRVVVVAIDGSEYAEYAFKYYVDEVMRGNDYVVLAFVPELYNYDFASPGVVEQLLNELAAKVKEVEKKYEPKVQELGLPGKFKTGEGKKAGEVICKIAHDEKAQLIVIGSRGLGKVRRTILGSVSDYVIHHAEVPVLVCKLSGHHHQQQKKC